MRGRVLGAVVAVMLFGGPLATGARAGTTSRVETRTYDGFMGDVVTLICAESNDRRDGYGYGGVCLSVFPGETAMDVVIDDDNSTHVGARYQWERDTETELTILSTGTICDQAHLAVPDTATVLLVQLGVLNNGTDGMACGAPSPATEGVVTATVT